MEKQWQNYSLWWLEQSFLKGLMNFKNRVLDTILQNSDLIDLVSGPGDWVSVFCFLFCCCCRSCLDLWGDYNLLVGSGTQGEICTATEGKPDSLCGAWRLLLKANHWLWTTSIPLFKVPLKGVVGASSAPTQTDYSLFGITLEQAMPSTLAAHGYFALQRRWKKQNARVEQTLNTY